VALERLDGTFAASAEISIGKARTAALFFETVTNQGRTAGAALPSLPDFAPLQGGVPIMAEDQVIGAFGISGAASPKQDEEIAILAAAAVKSNVAVAPPSAAAMTTTYLHHNTVGAAFAKRQPLLSPATRSMQAGATHRASPRSTSGRPTSSTSWTARPPS
jgi:hypothetical protein